jgi:hypothetical protein
LEALSFSLFSIMRLVPLASSKLRGHGPPKPPLPAGALAGQLSNLGTPIREGLSLHADDLRL